MRRHSRRAPRSLSVSFSAVASTRNPWELEGDSRAFPHHRYLNPVGVFLAAATQLNLAVGREVIP